jgi:3-oxoadipate enol-lactonase
MHARIGDLDIHYQIDGDGPWLTLSHALAASNEMWAAQLPVMTRHFKVLRVDTRGHGRSSAPTGPYTLEGLADDVHGLFRELGIARSHWLGMSLGGMIGQAFALKYPSELTSLVLADTTARGAPNAETMWAERSALARSQGMRGLTASTLARWFTDAFRSARPEVITSVVAMIEATPVEGYAGCCAAIAQLDVLDRLSTLDLPALVIVGEHDLATPPPMAHAMHERLAGSELMVLRGAAHIGNIEQADAFNAAALSFLMRAGAAH